MINRFGSEVSAAHWWRDELPICRVRMVSGKPVENSLESEKGEMPVLHHGKCCPFVAL